MINSLLMVNVTEYYNHLSESVEKQTFCNQLVIIALYHIER